MKCCDKSDSSPEKVGNAIFKKPQAFNPEIAVKEFCSSHTQKNMLQAFCF